MMVLALWLLTLSLSFRHGAFQSATRKSECAGHYKLKHIYRTIGQGYWCRNGANGGGGGETPVRLKRRAVSFWDQIDDFLERRRNTRREQARVRADGVTGFNATLVLTAVMSHPGRSARYLGCLLSHLDYALQWGYDLRIYREANPLSSDPWTAAYVDGACQRNSFLGGTVGPIKEKCRMAAFADVLGFRMMWTAKAMSEVLLMERRQGLENNGTNRDASSHYILYLDLDASLVGADDFPVHRIIADAVAACSLVAVPGVSPFAPAGLPLVVAQHQGCTVNTGMLLFRVSPIVLDEIIPLWIKEYGAFSERHQLAKVRSWNGDQGPFMNVVLRMQAQRYNGECGSTRLHTNSDRNRCFQRKLALQAGGRDVGPRPVCLLPTQGPYNNHDCGSEYRHGDFLHHRAGTAKCLESRALRDVFCQRAARCRAAPAAAAGTY
jgi:hypothetical protein